MSNKFIELRTRDNDEIDVHFGYGHDGFLNYKSIAITHESDTVILSVEEMNKLFVWWQEAQK